MLVGGLVGYVDESKITDCHADGSVSGKTTVGGFVGYVSEGEIYDCGASGSVNTASGIQCGGFAGLIQTNSIISRCYASGSVSGTNSVGGFTGQILNSDISDCYAAGSVSGDNSVGGFTGHAGFSNITGCYATGSVRGIDNVGGILGQSVSNTIKDCIALNPSLIRASGDSNLFMRIAGLYDINDTFSNNFAFSGMTVNGSVITENKGLDTPQGADVSAGQIIDPAFWTTAANWNTAPWDTTVWTIAAGKLPVLTGVGGTQNSEPGLYLNAIPGVGGSSTLSIKDTAPSSAVPGESVPLTAEGFAEWSVPTVSWSWDYTGSNGSIASTENGVANLVIPHSYEGDIVVTASSAKYGVSATHTIAVAKKTPALTDLIYDLTPKTYNDSAQSVSVTAAQGITGLGVITVKYDGGNAPTNAGTYAVTAEIAAGTHYAAKTLAIGNFVIHKAPAPSIQWPSASAISYGAPLSASTLSGGSTEYGSFAWADGSAIPTVQNSGFDVVFVPNEATLANYESIARITKPISVAVSKSGDAQGVDKTFEVAKEYAKSDYQFDLTLLLPNISGVTGASYSINSVVNTDGVLATVPSGAVTSPLTLNIANVPEVGKTAAITVTVSSDNYMDFDAVITVKTVDKMPVTISGVTMTGGEYKASAYAYSGTPVVKQSADGTKVNVALTSSYKGVNGTVYGPSDTAPADAGEYLLTLSVPNEHPTYAGSQSYAFSITKKNVMVKADDKSIRLNAPLPAATVSYSGFIDDDNAENALQTLAKAHLNVSDSDTEGTSVIDFSVQAVLNMSAGANYSLTHENGVLTISAKSTGCDITNVTSPSGARISGTSITASVSSSVSKVSVNVSVSDGASWKLYSDAGCLNEIIGDWSLSCGENTAYIKTAAQNGVASKIYALTVTRQHSNGGGSGGSGTPGLSGAPSLTITTESKPGEPSVATAVLTDKPNASGWLDMVIPEEMATKAVAAAKSKENGNNGTAVIFVNNAENPASLSVRISDEALNCLKNSGVKYVEFAASRFKMRLDASVISQLEAQTNGIITIQFVPVENLSDEAKKLIGNRPVFNITITDENGKQIDNFGGGSIRLALRYDARPGEEAGDLSIVYLPENGVPQILADSGYKDGWATWTCNRLSVYGIAYVSSESSVLSFKDATGHWAENHIRFVVEHGLLKGINETSFGPDVPITRGMFTTTLGRLSGQDTSAYVSSRFSDVDAGSYYLPYIEWAAENKIVQGVGDGRFDPNKEITREEMAVMLYNYANAANCALPASKEIMVFADDEAISLWAKSAVQAMQQAGIINGKPGNLFYPKAMATRAEASVVLHWFVELVAS